MSPRGFIGITSEDVLAGNANYRTSNLSAQAAIGVKLIRQTFKWRDIEYTPGFYILDPYDAYVMKLAAHGIRVLPVLFDSPTFHNGTTKTRPAFPPKSNSSMARFAQALVRRYGPRGTLWQQHPEIPKVPITAWQIWNEPNLPIYWRGRAERPQLREDGQDRGRRHPQGGPARRDRQRGAAPQHAAGRRAPHALHHPALQGPHRAFDQLAGHQLVRAATRASSAGC